MEAGASSSGTTRRRRAHGRRKGWRSKISAAVVFAFVIGDLPTLYQLVESQRRGISFWQVGESDRQLRTWRANIDCYGHATVLDGAPAVAVIVCPSGDVLVNFRSGEEPVPYWVPRPGETLPQTDLAETAGSALAAQARAPVRTAQGFEVICQRFIDRQRVLRRIRFPDGRCFDQVVDAYSGRILSQGPAPCDPSC
ncbi:hypothetical protein SH611_06175 [Geminicoccaceae bacterium 1502E]|nr:hypothetical protein [Geminicoccaceae bacterium 1502E]